MPSRANMCILWLRRIITLQPFTNACVLEEPQLRHHPPLCWWLEHPYWAKYQVKCISFFSHFAPGQNRVRKADLVCQFVASATFRCACSRASIFNATFNISPAVNVKSSNAVACRKIMAVAWNFWRSSKSPTLRQLSFDAEGKEFTPYWWLRSMLESFTPVYDNFNANQ